MLGIRVRIGIEGDILVLQIEVKAVFFVDRSLSCLNFVDTVTQIILVWLLVRVVF